MQLPLELIANYFKWQLLSLICDSITNLLVGMAINFMTNCSLSQGCIILCNDVTFIIFIIILSCLNPNITYLL